MGRQKNRSMPMMGNGSVPKLGLLLLLVLCVLPDLLEAAHAPVKTNAKNAYVTMLYMGTPRDYDFYVAARVMMQSLIRLKVDADLVVIASKAFPHRWARTLTKEGVRVVSVNDIENPYRGQPGFDMRFMYTLNKIYAWSLTEYERVVMLDVDNLFLRNSDELFQCGQFCACFINPCYFHTGLFVVEPSNETFRDMLHEIERGRENKDGADQGFLISYFDDLLDRPMFKPPTNGSRLNGLYRLSLGYQMDASYYYLKLRWHVPCGPNSVVTFPSVPLLKPWYWWAWPVLPLGLSWHEQRRSTIGYGAELPMLATEAFCYLLFLLTLLFVRKRFPVSEKPPLVKCLSRGPCTEHFSYVYPLTMKFMPVIAIAASFAFPFLIVPTTVHPLLGWGTFLLGSFTLLLLTLNFFQLPFLATITPWLEIIVVLFVMACPYYSNGIVRALAIGVYAFLAAPVLWWSLKEITTTRDFMGIREPLMAYNRQEPQSESMKLC